MQKTGRVAKIDKTIVANFSRAFIPPCYHSESLQLLKEKMPGGLLLSDQPLNPGALPMSQTGTLEAI